MELKVIVKRDFDGKVSPSICHKLNNICGQKWKIIEIVDILNSAEKHLLNELGRINTIDNEKVKYSSAHYLMVLPEQFVSLTGKQLYVWLYRESTDDSFRKVKINMGDYDGFDHAVVKNYYNKKKRV